MPEEETSLFRNLLRASSVGINLVISTFVGLAVGYFLDKFLGTGPWLLIVFTIFGIIAGFRELFKMAKSEEEKPTPDPSQEGNKDENSK